MRRAQSIEYKIYEVEKELAETKKKLAWAHKAEKDLLRQLAEAKVELKAMQEKEPVDTESHGSTKAYGT